MTLLSIWRTWFQGRKSTRRNSKKWVQTWRPFTISRRNTEWIRYRSWSGPVNPFGRKLIRPWILTMKLTGWKNRWRWGKPDLNNFAKHCVRKGTEYCHGLLQNWSSSFPFSACPMHLSNGDLYPGSISPQTGGTLWSCFLRRIKEGSTDSLKRQLPAGNSPGLCWL